MRRLVGIPVRTVAAAVVVLAGGLYVAAEARHAVTQRRQLEMARMENSIAPTQTSVAQPARPQPSASQTPASPASTSQPQVLKDAATIAGRSNSTAATAQQIVAPASTNDEVAAEQQAAQLPAQKPAKNKNGHTRQIVISIADRRLALMEDGQVVKTYPIAVGARGTPSPEGDFSVINHAKDPTYRHEGTEIAPGKDNPLGTRWMGLSLKGYGIHGTNVPSSIGKAASHGCFRMGKADVEDLYSRVQVGDAVTIRRQRDELIARVFAPAANTTLAAKVTNGGELQVAAAAGAAQTVEAEQ
ncbi:MAG TPA: L,D-transpeptidase family protein [Candidatus Angelobacter sp.]